MNQGRPVAIFTGSRNWTDWLAVYRRLESLPRNTLIVHGGHRWRKRQTFKSLDRIVDVLARAMDFEVIAYPAEWARYGLAAGPIRNRRMVDEYQTAVVHAFSLGGPGTRGCVSYARSVGLMVVLP